MTDFAITVRDRTVTVDRRPTVVVSGSVNIYTMSVALDGAWDGYTCRAVFRCGLELREALIVDGACAVPWEALVANGSLYIGVYGINGDKRMPTCWTSERIYVAPGTVTADASQDPSPTVFEELVAHTADNRAAAEAARDAAEAAKQGTAADRLAVAGDKTAVSADRAAVESVAQQVANDATRAGNAANAAVDAATESAKSETTAKDASAQAGRDAAQTAQDREAADASKVAAETAKTAAQTAETNAETAQTAAETARTGAQTAETNAGTYATNAGNSATAAAGSATDAQSAQAAANSARDAAVTAKTAAEAARDAASSSKTAAATSETAAASSASAAATSETNAASSAQAAANSAASLVVVNDLVTGGTSNALSAEQGKVLSASISDLTSDVDFNVTNIVTNGDFSNGTTGWSTYTGTLSALTNVLSLTSNTASSVPAIFQTTSTPSVSSHKIYITTRLKISNALANYAYVAVSGTSGGQVSASLGSGGHKSRPMQDVIYPLSVVLDTGTGLSGNLQFKIVFGYTDAATANGKVMEVKYALAIDLTATFGEGNEPTAAEMDAILAFYPNSWFDGTVNLANNTKLMPYLLAELRKKANVAQEGWITPTLVNGATALSGSSIGYMKDNFGFVHLKGRLIKETSGAVFGLPTGYRPAQSTTFASGAYLTSSYSAVATAVSASGDVIIYVGGSDVSKFVDISSITFKAV